MFNQDYFLGLDIGTDSVGYAVTNEEYALAKFKGEPMWGATVFEPANQCADRRAFRTARRRLDRKQQRVALIGELFAAEIAKIDPRFFIRRKESALYRGDTSDAGDTSLVFNDGNYKDRDMYKDYPTIHHLIVDLMSSDEPHDVRLVYLACAWLVAHRGHFLSEVDRDNIDNVRDFTAVYESFLEHFKENEYHMPWNCNPDEFAKVMQQKKGVSKKEKEFFNLLFDGKKPKSDQNELCPYSRASMIKLLCGGSVAPKDLFKSDSYSEVASFSLGMKDEDFEAVLSELGDDGQIVIVLKAMYDWAVLIDVLAGKDSISQAKVSIYEQHQQDLRGLKHFIKKYAKSDYNKIFRDIRPDNYVAYSHNFKSVKTDELPDKHLPSANKEVFSKYLLSIVKPIKCESEDMRFFEDMITRLELRAFLPKQVDSDNRVIPYQLYWHELDAILKHAQSYLPFLLDTDEMGLTVSDKIRSVFDFRVPYYVGPIDQKGDHHWLERKAGKIYPWNFTVKDDLDKSMVDLDKSEQAFISRMTNTCSYLPGEAVLPKNSICYTKFNVLNELNNLKINDKPVSVEVKQEIFKTLFEKRARVSPKQIQDYCMSHGHMRKSDVLSGIDITIKSSLKPLLDFSSLLSRKLLNEDDAERIIERITYTGDRMRLIKWLKREFPSLSEEDVRYVSRLKYSDFGRLSHELLYGIEGMNKATGECGTIMHFMWTMNVNLMQLLSDDFTFSSLIDQRRLDYYRDKPMSLNTRLDEMYISNAVKRPIIRTLDIVKEVVAAAGREPKKIFVEMARDAGDDKKGKRTKSRKEQLIELYDRLNTDEVRLVYDQLNSMGDSADNRLQSEVLFLYYLQLGKCMYSGEAINIDDLKKNIYNVDHIYPQCFVKDDSIINNKVLVRSELNALKDDDPINPQIRQKMIGYWTMLHHNGLISDEKFDRLKRSTPFSADEKMGFINRQLVETRQSTKAVATILKEMYPSSDIVYVKAGLVSDFRHEFDRLKTRSVNDLHHAKDAYLNIVVGNVYHERFSKQWFSPDQRYSIKTKTVFSSPVICQGRSIWKGAESLELVKKTVLKNNIHFTRYAFKRQGGFFDQMPLRQKDGLVPRKAGLDPKKYGGYNGPTAAFFIPVRYSVKKKLDVMIMPVELMFAQRFLSDSGYALEYAKDTVASIINKAVDNVEFPLGMRILKVNTLFSFDGCRACLSGKANRGKVVKLALMMPLKIDTKSEGYIKSLESFIEKRKKNANIVVNEKYDGITSEKNEQLYELFFTKLMSRPYSYFLENQRSTLEGGRDRFRALSPADQAACLMQMLMLLKTCNSGGCDLTLIGGVASAGVTSISSTLSNWKKKYREVYIIDASTAGLFEKRSINLLDLL